MTPAAKIVCPILVLAGLLMPGGCRTAEQSPAGSGGCIRPAELSIQPSFSRIVDPATGQSQRGSQKLLLFLQLHDSFGDTMKMPGRFRLELYRFKPGTNNDIRAAQRYETGGLFQFDLSEPNANQSHWDKTTHSYLFELDCPPDLGTAQAIVVQASFDNDQVRLNQVRVVGR